jgi:DNA-binding CsgD family transcriptional regulator/MFS family permease
MSHEAGDKVKKNKWILYCSIIAVCFLWTGTAYISQAYRLLDLYTAPQVDIITQILYYIMQVIGLAAFSFFMKRLPGIFSSRLAFVVVILAEAVIIPAVLIVNAPMAILILGFLMNLLHGVVAGCYLTQLASFVPKRHRGKAFGCGYAIGSFGSWLISLPYDGKFLQTKGVITVYLLLMALSIILLKFADSISTEDDICENKLILSDFRLWTIVFFVILFTFTKSVGFYFPLADISGIVNLEFSRAFYAVGLVAAGIINDKSRKYGAVCCLIALIFPFIAIALNDEPSIVAVMWIMGYIFFGFIAVYRVILFTDIAGKHGSLLPLAGVGLLSGRIGDVLGTLGGILCKDSMIALLAVSGIAMAVVIPFFLHIYQKLYIPILTEEKYQEVWCKRFEIQYKLSDREREVFRMLILGWSNQEVAGKLHISESTVKFHVTNILKKTGCRNRTEVTALFEKDAYLLQEHGLYVIEQVKG